jgi:tetraprenyl-beta-curcumene synthase
MDPTPLTCRQFGAFLGVLARHTTWTTPRVSRQLAFWHAIALNIPNETLREDALATLASERLNSEGAALFAVLPRRRNEALVRLLVAYQTALDYLDTVTERPSADALLHGLQLHRALEEALDPGGPLSDYFLYRPADSDGGYLRSLVECCRTACSALPGYPGIREHAMRAGARLAVQVLNHDPTPARRDAALVAWARREFPAAVQTEWWEQTAAASSTLGLYALLALATEPAVDRDEVAAVDDAYHPWICMACTLLDCLVDRDEDALTGAHNYLDHYPSLEIALLRLHKIVALSATRARHLPRGRRHAIITTAMIAMYLSKDTARSPQLPPVSTGLARAAGTLVRIELPLLRALRLARRRPSPAALRASRLPLNTTICEKG